MVTSTPDRRRHTPNHSNDLYQLFPQRGQRPAFHLLRQRPVNVDSSLALAADWVSATIRARLDGKTDQGGEVVDLRSRERRKGLDAKSVASQQVCRPQVVKYRTESVDVVADIQPRLWLHFQTVPLSDLV